MIERTDAEAPEMEAELGSRPRMTEERRDAERAALVAGLKDGDDSAAAELFDLYQEYVVRLLSRLIGYDSEISDALQDVFLRVYRGIHRLRSPEALTTWMTRVTTLTAIDILRKRRRRRWLRYVAPESMPDVEVEGIDESGQAALLRTHRLLDRLPPEQRVAFSLRKMCGLELTEVAESCGCSLSTIKRRIASAEAEFTRLALEDPVLSVRLRAEREAERSAK